MGTHLRVLSESYPMSTNMTGFKGFHKTLHAYDFDESSFSIGRVNLGNHAWVYACAIIKFF